MTHTDTTPAARLSQWLVRGRLTQTEGAKILGIRQDLLSRILHGHRVPTLRTAVKIEARTGIRCDAWAAYVGGRRVTETTPRGAKRAHDKA